MHRSTIALFFVAAVATGCGSMAVRGPASGIQLAVAESQGQPPPLDSSVFVKPADRQNLSEEAIKQVLDAPITVDLPARAGIVALDAPFTRSAYANPEPGDEAPQLLARAFEKSSHFRLVSDISPYLVEGQHIEDLRELAVRYRLKYLVILNTRYVDRSHVNPIGWSWIPLVTIPFVPAYTLKTDGLLEATLLDVRTGTLLFTTQVHVHAWERTTPFSTENKLKALQRQASRQAVDRLARAFLGRCQRVITQARLDQRPSTPSTSVGAAKVASTVPEEPSGS